MAIEIVSFPNENDDFPVRYVSRYQRGLWPKGDEVTLFLAPVEPSQHDADKDTAQLMHLPMLKAFCHRYYLIFQLKYTSSMGNRNHQQRVCSIRIFPGCWYVDHVDQSES